MWHDAFPSFLIALREGLEAGLIVSILVATLVRAGQRARLGAVWTGVGAAAALSLSFAAVLTFTAADFSATGQDVFGGVLSLAAVAFVTAMAFWMRRCAPAHAGEVKAKAAGALAGGAAVLALTSFAAVAREGLEASLFLWTTARSAGESHGPMIGVVVGLSLALAACLGLYRRVLKLNLGRFFTVTGVVLIVIAAGVLAYGLGDLQESGLLPGRRTHAFTLTAVDAGSWYATLVAGTFNLTPSMSVLQVTGYLLYLIPVTVLFIRAPRTIPAASTHTPTQPTARLRYSERRAAARAADESALAARAAVRREAKARRAASPPRIARWVVGTSVLAVPALGAVTAVAVMGARPAARSNAVALDEKTCGSGWTDPTAGAQAIDLSNKADNTAEVFLIDPATNAVFAEIENLAPGTTRPVAVTLTAGAYAFRCAFTDGTALTSKTYTVTGESAGAAPGFAPVTDQDLAQPVADYRAYVQRNLPALLADSQRLDADLAAGDPVRAKADWLVAHLDYERLGAAYGTFGGYDAKIDGRADGLPGGVADPSWTGFHRIEYELWHDRPAAGSRPLGDRLVSDVNALIKAFPALETDPNDLPLRTHEILENSLRFQLTGIADYGSGTDLATAAANLEGTRQVLGTLAGLLGDRDPAALARIRRGLGTVAADLAEAHRPDGGWNAAAGLPAFQRQKLDGDLGALLEDLAVVPRLLEERSSA